MDLREHSPDYQWVPPSGSKIADTKIGAFPTSPELPGRVKSLEQYWGIFRRHNQRIIGEVFCCHLEGWFS